VRRDLPRTFLADALVKIRDRGTQRAGDLKQPARGYAIDPAFVFMRLLVSHADHLCQLLLGQAQHNAPLANTSTDVVVNGGG
jgi:hypothetical protein